MIASGAVPILTREWGWRRIDEVRVGDHVVTSAGTWSPVAARLADHPERPRASAFVDVVTIAKRREVRVRVTPDHRLWVEGKGWREAAKLKAGDPIRALTEPDRVRHGEPARFIVAPVAGVEKVETPYAIPLWDLDVPGERSYVTAGGMVSHNCACFIRPALPGARVA